MNSTKAERNAHLGVDEMDREHALETQIVRALQAALAGADPSAARALFERLEDVTNAHFLAEQLLMRLHAYPAYEAHQEEHDRLMADLRQMRSSAEALAPQTAPAALIDRLERWLGDHMHTTDAVLAEFLRRPAASAG